MMWNLTSKRPGGAAQVVGRLAFIRSLQTALNIHPSDSLGYNNNNVIKTFMIGKKVEVSLRLFDTFQRNMVFIFLWGSWGFHRAK